MNVVIDLTPEEVARLRVVAGKEGVEPAEYAGRLVRDHLPQGDPDSEMTDHRAAEADLLHSAIARMTNRSAEEKAAARAHALAAYPARRPLPPGMTFADVISGNWPGDETDDQVNAALEELS